MRVSDVVNAVCRPLDFMRKMVDDWERDRNWKAIVEGFRRRDAEERDAARQKWWAENRPAKETLYVCESCGHEDTYDNPCATCEPMFDSEECLECDYYRSDELECTFCRDGVMHAVEPAMTQEDADQQDFLVDA